MSWERPTVDERSYTILWSAFTSKQISFGQFIRGLGTRFPQATYPAGEPEYWKSVEEYGAEYWSAPHNVWRQACHYLGGLVVGSFIWNPLVATLLVGTALLIKEAAEVVKNKSFRIKNLIDIFAWTAGAASSSYIIATTINLLN